LSRRVLGSIWKRKCSGGFAHEKNPYGKTIPLGLRLRLIKTKRRL
jgi:hypothetical protein